MKFISFIYFCFLEISFHCVAQAGLEFVILLPQPPNLLGLQTCPNVPGSYTSYKYRLKVILYTLCNKVSWHGIFYL
jgi:hypothetical protein